MSALVKCTVAPTADFGGARLGIAHLTCGVNYDQGEPLRAIKLTMVRQLPCSFVSRFFIIGHASEPAIGVFGNQ